MSNMPDGIWQGAAGGTILGATTTAMLATTGKLIGLSGIFDGVASRASGQGWKVVFLSGFTAGGAIAGIMYPAGVSQAGAPPVPLLGLVLSGFLVGLGTRLSNGCTSGHGLCGLPRLSRRSIVAVLTFMTSGVATASVMSAWREEGGVGRSAAQENPSLPLRYGLIVASTAGAARTLWREREKWRAYLASFISGASFAGGLVLSGMVRRAKVVDFLALRRNTWDPSLAFVMGGGVLVSIIGFPYFTRHFGAPVCRTPVQGHAEAEKLKGSSDVAAAAVAAASVALSSVASATSSTSTTPAGLAEKFEIPKNTELDVPLILGAWLFGIGWGSAGLCPGPAVVAAAYGLPSVGVFFIPSMIAGMKAAGPLNNAVDLPSPSWVTGA